MRYVFLFLICSAAWAADPVPEAKLPADVQRVVDARDAEVAKAKAAYDAAVAKATAAAVKQVEAVVKAKTQKGDLEGALAGKSVVDKWNGEAVDLLGGKTDTMKIVVGKWRQNGKLEMTFDEGGSASCSNGDQGKWEIAGDKLIVTWISGWKDTYNITADQVDTFSGTGSKGGQLTIVRVKTRP